MRWLRPQQPGRRSSGASRAVCALPLIVYRRHRRRQPVTVGSRSCMARGIGLPRQNEMHTAISSALARPRRIYSLRFCLHCRVYTVQQSSRSQPESYRRDDLDWPRAEREREPASPGRAAVLTQHPHGRCHYLSFILPGPGARQRCNYTALAPPPYQTQSSPPDQAEPPAARFLKAHTRTAQSEAACFGGSGCVFWRACCAGASGRLWTDL